MIVGITVLTIMLYALAGAVVSLVVLPSEWDEDVRYGPVAIVLASLLLWPVTLPLAIARQRAVQRVGRWAGSWVLAHREVLCMVWHRRV